MFEQYGSDYSKPSLDLNSLLPSVNQSEVTHSFLGTLFQRWITKPELQDVSGVIASYKNPIADAVTELTRSRQIQQLVPVFFSEYGTEQKVFDWDDLVRKASFSGVDPSTYSKWGRVQMCAFAPPIVLDMLLNWVDYFWIDRTLVTAPEYITIDRRGTSEWSRQNNWYHKSDISPEDQPYAKQAVMPIIQFSNIELSEWVKAVRKWQYRNSITDSFRDVEYQPSLQEIQSLDFVDRWKLTAESFEPCEPRVAVTTPTVVTPYAPVLQLPSYVQYSASVRVYYTVDGNTHRTYDFVELTDTSISIGDTVPVDSELTVYVGSSIDADVGKERALVNKNGVTQVANLSEYFFVGQFKSSLNQLPVFNLYKPTGEFARTGFVWKFQTLDSNSILGLVDQRIVSSNAFEDFTFDMDMVETGGQLRAFKDAETGMLSTVWSNKQVRLPTTVEPGIWDISEMLATNPKRETRSSVRLSEIIQHVEASNRGESTILLGDDGSNLWLSSMLSDNLSAPNLIEFVSQQRKHSFQEIQSRFVGAIVDVITNTTVVKIAEIPTVIYEQIKTQYSYPVEHNIAFVDSGSYNPVTGSGFPNIMLSFSQLGLTEYAEPGFAYLNASGKYVVPTHDTVDSQSIEVEVSMLPLQLLSIEQAAARSSTVTVSPTPPTPTSPRDYWRNQLTGGLYRFEVDFFDSSPPTVVNVGDIWYDSSSSRCFTWSGVTSNWEEVPIVNYWILLDIEAVLASVFMLFERDLWVRTVEMSPQLIDFSPIRTEYADQLATVVNRARETRLMEAIQQNKLLSTAEFDSKWSRSFDRLADLISGLYSVSPLDFFTQLIDPHSITLNGLRINPTTENVYTSQDPLHGEGGFVDPSFLRTVTLFARYRKIDNQNNSPLDTWKQWSTRLAYRTNSLINPQTLRIYDNCETLEDYSIVLKKSENTSTIDFSNIIITLNEAGDSADIPYGRGDNWKFKLTCSGPNTLSRKRFGVKKQRVFWNAILQTFETDAGQNTLWQTGDAVTLANSYGDITKYQQLYVRVLSSTKIQLTETQDVSVNPTGSYIDFAGAAQTDGVLIQTVESTFTTSSSFGSTDWEAMLPDQSQVIAFDFPVVVNSIQELIDFTQGYTAYMVAAGVVFNDGERPEIDVDTGTVISWRQQLIKAIGKLYDSSGLTNRDYYAMGRFTDRLQLNQPYIEMNPFATGVWIKTPTGVVCDLFNTPYVGELQSSAALFDDQGDAITTYATPLRSDNITTIFYSPPQSPSNVTNDPLLNQHMGSGHVSLDRYEHVVLFDEMVRSGLVIYDRFFNLHKTSFNVEFQRAITHRHRPNLGGFVVTSTETIPNFETVADNQRNDFNSTLSNELVPTTQAVRTMFGKKPLKYFSTIPVTSKTEFNFWQKLIREKGTTDSILRFGKHQLYDNFGVDDFWAWKLGTFGSSVTRRQFEVYTSRDMMGRDNLILSMGESPLVVNSKFPVFHISPLNDAAWRDYPTALEHFEQSGYVRFKASHTVASVGMYNAQTGVSRGNLLDVGTPVITNIQHDAFVVEVLVFESQTGESSFTVQQDTNALYIGFTPSPLTSLFAYNNGVSIPIVTIANGVATFATTLHAGDTVTVVELSNPVQVSCVNAVANESATFVDLSGNQIIYQFATINSAVVVPSVITHHPEYVTVFLLKGTLPTYGEYSPVRLADTLTEKIIQQFPAWDPAKGVHSNIVGELDIISPTNPAKFGTDRLYTDNSQMWSSPQLGQYWWDTSEIQYKPYADSFRNTFDETSSEWGRLFDNIKPVIYQWTEQYTPPSDTSEAGGQPYSRILTKSRKFCSILSAEQNTVGFTGVFNTPTAHPFQTGDVVAIYSTSIGDPDTILDGIDQATEYVFETTSTTAFRLRELNEDSSTTYIVPTEFSGEFYLADANWSAYEYELVTATEQVFYVATNTSSNPTRDFVLTDPVMLDRVSLEDFIKVWVDGVQAAFQYNANTKVLNIVDPNSSALTVLDLAPNQQVFVRCVPPEPNMSVEPDVTTRVNTVVLRDIPYTKIVTTEDETLISRYYFWASAISTTKPKRKRFTTVQVEQELQYPSSQNFFAVRSPTFNPTTLAFEYQAIQIRGIRDTKAPETKVLCIDFDQSLRSTYHSSNIKPVHESWLVFREFQTGVIPRPVWNCVVQTLVGFDVDRYVRSSMVDKLPVPSKARVAYDYFSNSSSRYGTLPSQTLLDRYAALELFVAIMSDPLINTSDDILNRVATVDTFNDTAMFNLLQYVYEFAPPSAVNKLTFTLIRVGLFNGYQYSGLFKTSYMSLTSSHQIVRGDI